MMNTTGPLSIPVILGTPRQGRMSEHVARFVLGELSKHDAIETILIDIRTLAIPITDAGETIKDVKFSTTIMRADALVLVVPEYNHGYPGLLKHVLDTNLKEYIHKAVGICGVSAGGLGGTRVIENLLPVLRELGLVTIFWDGNFSNVQHLFDANGALIDQVYVKRMDKFIKELVWMARTLRTDGRTSRGRNSCGTTADRRQYGKDECNEVSTVATLPAPWPSSMLPKRCANTRRSLGCSWSSSAGRPMCSTSRRLRVGWPIVRFGSGTSGKWAMDGE